MFIIARLRHQDIMMSTAGFDEVVAANIFHDLRAGEDLSMELLLQLVHRLCVASASSPHPTLPKAASHDAATILTCSSRF